MTQNEHKHIHANCCRPEVDDDYISGRNVKTVEGYVLVHFEVIGFNSFLYIHKNHFVMTAEVAAADFNDSINRKRVRVSLSN